MQRLAKHFLLLDFLYDQSTMDCVANGADLSDRIASIREGSEVFEEGQYLCSRILEPIVEAHGPVSVAAGLWFRDLPGQGGAHGKGLAPHQWIRETGAAADIVVHSWVNQCKNPDCFLKTLPGSNIEYNRVIPYPGSEFCCLASQSQGNTFGPGEKKWEEIKARADKVTSGRKGWRRRRPYTQSHGTKLKPLPEYRNRLIDAESLWTEAPTNEIRNEMTRSIVYGRKSPKYRPLLDHSIVEVPMSAFSDHPANGRKIIRPWHVRVSENFVLLDFCRNERMLERGMVTVPPLTFRTANSVIKVARMFGEVLDPVKKYLGNISVVRGMEPEDFSRDDDAKYFRWIPALGDVHSIEFVTPEDPKPGYLERLARKDCVVDDDTESEYDPVLKSDRVRVTIRGFTPSHCFTSADDEEFRWTE